MNKKTKKLLTENNLLDKNINEENRAVFTDMICYIRSGNISDYNQELVRRDLTEMILSAQGRGDNIYDVIGEDFKIFCDNVIESLPPKTRKEKLLDSLDVLCHCLAILGFIRIAFSGDTAALLQGLFEKEAVNYTIGITSGDIISIIIIILLSVFIVESVTKYAFRKQDKSKSIQKGALIGTGTAIVCLLIARFGNQVLFTLNILAALIIIILLYTAHRFLSEMQR